MNLRRILLMGLGLGLLAAMGAVFWPSSRAEPTVKGQPISIWLRKVPLMQVGEAAEAGTNAVPFLARAARAHSTIPYRLSWRLWSLLPPPLRSRVQPPTPIALVRLNALMALRDFGPEAEPALEVVLRTAEKDPDFLNRGFALQAAAAIDVDHPRTLALLKRGLQSANPLVRGEALNALYMSGLCPLSLTNLIRLETPDTNQVYLNELLALGGLGPDVAPFVPRILPFVADPSTRGNALAALDRAGSGAAAAVPVMVELLGSPETGIRCKAAAVLMGIGPSAKEAVPVLEALMQDQALAVRVMAAMARARITGDPGPSVPVVLAALKAGDDGSSWFLPQGSFGLHNYGFNARQTALWFAGELGPAAHEGLPALINQMQQGTDPHRVVAARSVWKVGGPPDRCLLVLQSCLASRDEMARVLACYSLGEIGSPAASLIPDLERAERTTLATRRAARLAIQRIENADRSGSLQPR
jgi:HEAT repeat protein